MTLTGGRTHPDQIIGRQPSYHRYSWTTTFLEVLRQTGNLTKSAAAAGCSRQNVRYLRVNNAEFEAAVRDALDEACDLLEAEARRRAVEGVERLKFDQRGNVINDPRTGQPYIDIDYSDTLLIFLLKAHRPELYRERPTVSVDYMAQAMEIEARRRGIAPEELIEAVYRVLRPDVEGPISVPPPMDMVVDGEMLSDELPADAVVEDAP